MGTNDGYEKYPSNIVEMDDNVIARKSIAPAQLENQLNSGKVILKFNYLSSIGVQMGGVATVLTPPPFWDIL